MLSLKDVSCSYDGRNMVLRGVSMNVNAGQIVTLMGSNGAGKTTTMRVITGLLRAKSGTVESNGKPISQLRPDQIVREGISLVPEGRKIFPKLTVKENLEVGAFTRRRERGAIEEGLDRVWELFPVLKKRQAQLGGTLSGGEQQMLAIGRALMSRPRLLLLDEPSLGLAPQMVQTIFSFIREINSTGVTILLVEQNANLALKISDYGYVLQTGRVILDGKCEDLRHNPLVEEAYLGKRG